MRNFTINRILILLVGAIAVNLPAAVALEGYYTEEEVRTYDQSSQPDKVHTRKSWYAGDRMFKDEAWFGKTIARFDLDKIYILDERTETYIEVSASFIQKFSTVGLSGFGIKKEGSQEVSFPEDLFIRTETTRKIGAWDCYQVMTNPKYRDPKVPYAIFWYSTDVDFPVQVYGEQLKQLFGDSPEVDGLFNRLNKFEGYPVRSEAHGLGSSTITTLIKIEHRAEIDPAIFEIPDDYNGMPLPEDLPDMNGK